MISRKRLLRITVIFFLEPSPLYVSASISVKAFDTRVKPTGIPIGHSVASCAGSKAVEDSASAHFQRVEITAVHGNQLQLNITWVFGADPPSVLRYGWSDYPVMPLYNSFGLPSPPFVMPITSP